MRHAQGQEGNADTDNDGDWRRSPEARRVLATSERRLRWMRTAELHRLVREGNYSAAWRLLGVLQECGIATVGDFNVMLSGACATPESQAHNSRLTNGRTCDF